MRKKLVFPIVLALALAHCGGKAEKNTGPQGGEVKFSVKTFPVKVEEIKRSLSFSGTVQAWKKMNIIPKISGKVKRIYVDEGESVRKGQLLAELDSEQAEIQLQQAKGALLAARANFQDARKNFLRAKKLLAQEAISKQQFEKAQLAFQAAKGQLKQAEAAVKLAEFVINSSKLTAPFSGIITNKLKEEGDFVNPGMGGFGGSPGILVLMDFSRVKVYVDVPSSKIDLITKGSPAIVVWRDRTFKGKVFSVSQAADPTSKTFRVGVEAENPGLLLKPGTDVLVRIIYRRKKALAIPARAIVEGNFAFVVDKGVARKRRLRLGLAGDRFVEVVEGVSRGEKVVVEGLFGLYDGAKVEEEK